MKAKLSTLWIFAALNYLYCDVVSLMDHDLLRQYVAGRINGIDVSQGFLLGAGIPGRINGINVSQGFLLGAGILVEVPMAMVLLSGKRWANIVAGAFMTAVQAATLFVKVPTPYYAFFSIIEIATTAAIAWLAWRWAADAPTLNQMPIHASPEPN